MPRGYKSLHGNQVGISSKGALVVDGKLTPRLNYTNTAASTAISNVTAETLFSTFATIKANTLDVGSLISIRYQGIAPATDSTDTLAVKLYIGGLAGTLLLSTPALDVANDMTFSGEYELIIRTIGTSGTMVGAGTFKSAFAAEGTIVLKDDILASTTINTTTDKVIGLSATWSVAAVANSCRLDFLRVIQW